MIPKHSFIFALFLVFLACETGQQEEPIPPLTEDQVFKELREIHCEYGLNPERVQRIPGRKAEGELSVEAFEEFKTLLRKELEMETSVPRRTRMEAKALIRKSMLEETDKCQ